MKLITRFSGFLTISALSAAMFLTGCSPNNSATAPNPTTTTSAPVAVPQTAVAEPAPSPLYTPDISALPPQVVQLGCPVAAYDLQNVLSGMYGVDGYNRPVNAQDVPVDTNGNCLSTASVPDVYSAAVAPAYVFVLSGRYHYNYYYRPNYVHVIIVPGVRYRQNVVPTGHVIIQTTPRVGTTVTVPVGVSKNVRPGAPSTTVVPGATTTVRPGAPSTTVAPGAATTVKPGAPVSAPAAAIGSTVTPPKAAGQTNTFNRPGQTPAAAPAVPAPAKVVPTPSSVTPPHQTAAPTVFNRPTAVPARPAAAPAAPTNSVTPSRPAAPTSTFNRPRK
jgi:hypothetical protein